MPKTDTSACSFFCKKATGLSILPSSDGRISCDTKSQLYVSKGQLYDAKGQLYNAKGQLYGSEVETDS